MSRSKYDPRVPSASAGPAQRKSAGGMGRVRVSLGVCGELREVAQSCTLHNGAGYKLRPNAARGDAPCPRQVCLMRKTQAKRPTGLAGRCTTRPPDSLSQCRVLLPPISSTDRAWEREPMRTPAGRHPPLPVRTRRTQERPGMRRTSPSVAVFGSWGQEQGRAHPEDAPACLRSLGGPPTALVQGLGLGVHLSHRPGQFGIDLVMDVDDAVV